MAKDTFYFSHDYNTRTDSKIKKLIAKHGFAGYGIFWAILEELYNNGNILPTDYKLLLSDRKANPELIQKVVEDFDLFVVESGNFYSVSVEKRINKRNIKSEKAKESAKLRWNKGNEDANAMRTHSEGNAIKESKGKESKGKESKGKDKKETKVKASVYVVEPFHEIDFLIQKFSSDEKWIADCCYGLSCEPLRVRDLMQRFKVHLGTQKIYEKKETDFMTHFMNWARKQRDSTRKKDSFAERNQELEMKIQSMSNTPNRLLNGIQ